jgi:hypothetical protein
VSALGKKSEMSQKQKERIQQLTREGKGANQIQKTLQKEGRGIRRKTLLSEVRKVKNQPTKPIEERQKYIPIKYRNEPKFRMSRKQVTLTGTIHGEKKIKQRRSSSGSQLYEWIKEEITDGEWDSKPKVTSE